MHPNTCVSTCIVALHLYIRSRARCDAYICGHLRFISPRNAASSAAVVDALVAMAETSVQGENTQRWQTTLIHVCACRAARPVRVRSAVMVARCVAQVPQLQRDMQQFSPIVCALLQICRGGEAVEFARDDVVDALLQVTCSELNDVTT